MPNLLPEYRRIFTVTRMEQKWESPSTAHTEQTHQFSPLLPLAQKPRSTTVFSNLGQCSANTDSLAPFLEILIQSGLVGSEGREKEGREEEECPEGNFFFFLIKLFKWIWWSPRFENYLPIPIKKIDWYRQAIPLLHSWCFSLNIIKVDCQNQETDIDTILWIQV